ncbi:hypothetical protein GOODEAATRI_032810 [Goodea atripinnis]|uniref:DUF6729 domain-containing protein n=1 Tax=Goodea atripinnis TaxID=208336 RepID=A0ABV0Q3Q2_9TELE
MDRRCILNQMEVQFGLYRGQTFHWLLTHDLGYTVGLLASHEAEREAGCSSSPLLCNKDALLEYARLFKEVTAAIVDKRRTGFGEYSTLTYRELYESSYPQISSRAGSQAASCTTRAASPSPHRQSYTPRKKRAMVLYSKLTADRGGVSIIPKGAVLTPPLVICSTVSLEEDDLLMVEAASAVEQELSASGESCSWSIFPTHFITMCMIVTVLDCASVAAPSSASPLLTPSPSADKPSAPAVQVVLLESWKSSLPPEQQEWLSRALFIKDRTGRAVLSKELQLLYHPPGPRLIYSQPPSSPDAFFQRRFFLWAPYRMWHYSLKCPSCAHKLTSCGLYKTVRRVLDLDGWYYMGMEYLKCRMSCDKKVLSQMKGRTLGNSANRLHSFLVENHTERLLSETIQAFM